jgi:hypothetical protein
MEPATTGEFKTFQLGLLASVFIPLAKTVELLCGLSFLTEIHDLG